MPENDTGNSHIIGDLVKICWYDIISIDIVERGEFHYLIYNNNYDDHGVYFRFNGLVIMSSIVSILVNGYYPYGLNKTFGVINDYDTILSNNNLIDKLLLITHILRRLNKENMLIADVSRNIMTVLLDMI